MRFEPSSCLIFAHAILQCIPHSFLCTCYPGTTSSAWGVVYRYEYACHNSYGNSSAQSSNSGPMSAGTYTQSLVFMTVPDTGGTVAVGGKSETTQRLPVSFATSLPLHCNRDTTDLGVSMAFPRQVYFSNIFSKERKYTYHAKHAVRACFSWDIGMKFWT